VEEEKEKRMIVNNIKIHYIYVGRVSKDMYQKFWNKMEWEGRSNGE
jgi:hypothetical protein